MKVIILRDEEYCRTKVFSSEEIFLEYLRFYYPKAKNLRLKRNEFGGNLMAYNHNSPIYYWGYSLEEIEVDEELKKHEEYRKRW